MRMERYRKIIWENLRHFFLLPFLTATGIFLVTALMFNLSALSEREAAKPIEFFLSFVGVMLLTPVFYPEQNQELRDVISSKRTSYLVVCALRVVCSVAAAAVLVTLFAGLLKWNESAVTNAHSYGGLATAVFLGAIGFCVAGITDNTTLGYMAAVLYYLLNYGMKDRLGKFYLFSMSAGRFEGKEWLFLGALVLIAGTFAVLFFRRKRWGY